MEDREIYQKLVALGFNKSTDDVNINYESIWRWLEKEKSVVIKVGPGFSWEFQYGDCIYRSSKLCYFQNLKRSVLDAVAQYLLIEESKNNITTDA